MANEALLSIASKLGASAVQFIISLVLARLLGPEAFGLVGMVTAVTMFAGVIVEFGVGPALIRHKTLDKPTVDAAFSTTLLLGVVASVAVAALAPGIAALYRRPSLLGLTRWAALSFVINSAAIVPRALALRAMKASRVALVELVAAIVGGCCGVGVALVGGGVWALICSSLCGGALQTVLLLWMCGCAPRLAGNLAPARSLLNVSLYLCAFASINYWARWADNFVIGLWLGERELGLYGRAYSLMLLPTTQLTGVLANVALPVLSQLQDDHPKARAVYLRTIGSLAFVAFPLMLGVGAVSGPLVRVLFGAKWVGAAPMLSLLAPVGAIQAVLSSAGWLYMSQGRTDIMFKWSLVTGGVFVAGFVWGARLGSAAHVAAIYLCANCVLAAPSLAIPARLIGLTLKQLVRAVAPTGVAAVLMALVVWAVDRWLAQRGDAVRLAVDVSVGCACYLSAARAFRVEAMQDASSYLRRISSRREAPCS